MKKDFLLRMLPHAAAIVLFAAASLIYFQPLTKGYDLRQGDIDHWRGMSKEIFDYRLLHEEEPLWTNAPFGGMPAYQISTEHSSNLLRPVLIALKLGLPGAAGTLFLAMLGFYILGLCLRINPWLSMAGALAFGFSTIHILYLSAGHTAKVTAIALMPPVLGGLILSFRGKPLLGASVFMLFLGLQISANHLQMTYYLAILCALVAAGEIIRLLLNRQMRALGIACISLAPATALAVLPGISNLMTTSEYSSHTTRGKTELTTEPDGSPKSASELSGLEENYILEYNFAPGEQWSLLIPNARGGQSRAIGSEKEILRKVKSPYRKTIAQQNQYWGGQRFTGGAFYFGAGSALLCILGFFFVRDSLKWPLLLATVLALGLCLKPMTGLNSLFIHSFPLYNKFRDSKMILVLIQVVSPLMAILFVRQLVEDEWTARSRRWLLMGSGIALLISISVVIRPEITGPFLSEDEIAQFEELEGGSGRNAEELESVDAIRQSLKAARMDLFRADASRSLLFMVASVGVALLSIFRIVKIWQAGAILSILFLADLWSVDRRYLNNDKQRNEYAYYEAAGEKAIPYEPSAADRFILERESAGSPAFDSTQSELLDAMRESRLYRQVKNQDLLDEISAFGALHLTTDYRVLRLSDPFNDGETPYFHKSVGGYHGAKLKRYQELIDYHLQPELRELVDSLKSTRSLGVLASLPVINMLNTRYLIYSPDAPPIENPYAAGNAWFVQNAVIAESADEEIRALDTLDIREAAVVRAEDGEHFTPAGQPDSTAVVTLDRYATRSLTFQCNSAHGGAIVFSEIHYPAGWVCRVDGQEVPYARVNYVLRGITVPAGSHTIEWSFEPQVWKTAGLLSLAGSSAVLLLFALSLGWSIRNNLRGGTMDH